MIAVVSIFVGIVLLWKKNGNVSLISTLSAGTALPVQPTLPTVTATSRLISASLPTPTSLQQEACSLTSSVSPIANVSGASNIGSMPDVKDADYGELLTKLQKLSAGAAA